jgi:ER membrane protein complex subunit 1
VGFVTRFATASYASVSAAISHESGLHRDEFGFRKIIVAATEHGKIFGIDSSNGNIVWSRILGLGSVASVGGAIAPLKMFVVKTNSDGEVPQVVLLAVLRGFDVRADTIPCFHSHTTLTFDLRAPSVRFCTTLMRSREKTKRITPPTVIFFKEQ